MSHVILILCALGFCVSSFMEYKRKRAASGLLRERSVVQTPRAKLLGGLSNSTIGLVYYTALGGASFFLANHSIWLLGVLAAFAAAAMSAYLAYSLFFVTRMPCIYCWTSHVVNWLLPVALFMVPHCAPYP